MALLTLAVIAILLYFIFKISQTYLQRSNLPHPKQEPFWRRLLKEPSPEQLVEWALTVPNDGLVSYRGPLNQEKIIVCSIAGAKTITENNVETIGPHPGVAKQLQTLLGDGLVMAWGEEHKIQRKQLNPVFKIQAIRGLYPIFLQKSQELLGVLETQTTTTDQFELTNLFHRTTLDVIGLAGFGMDFKCLSEPENELWKEYASVFGFSPEASWARLLLLVMPSFHALLSRHLKWTEKSRIALSKMRSRIEKVIEQKRLSDKTETGATDLISLLLRQNLITSTPKLLDQSLTILGAGHDTVASTLSLCMYYLSLHPSKQETLRQEILSNFSSNPTPKDLETLESLPYLNAIITETLRLRPVIPSSAKQLTAPTEICGHVLPAGTPLSLCRGALQQNPELWNHDPKEWYPERWISNPNGGAKERLAFLGFGAGPRNCIGERFARAELGCLIAEVVRNFGVEFVGVGETGDEEEVRMVQGIVWRIEGGLWVKLKKLEK